MKQLEEIVTKQVETTRDHSKVVRPPEYYATRLRRSKLELIQVATEIDFIDEIPTWKKFGMMIVKGNKYSELIEQHQKLIDTKTVLKKRIEMASDLMVGDTTYHSERVFDGYETYHGLQYIDLTTEDVQPADGQDKVVEIDNVVPFSRN